MARRHPGQRRRSRLGDAAHLLRTLRLLPPRSSAPVRDDGVHRPQSDWGGMAELANLEEYQVFRIPDGVSDEQGALIEPCAVAAAVSRAAAVRTG